MRTNHLFLGCLFFTLVLFLSSVPAQDYTKWGLPEGATARIGKGVITSNIAYSPDGSRLAIGTALGIWIYDAHTGKELDLLIGHTRIVTSVAYSPDGKALATASRVVRLWDANTGKHRVTLKRQADDGYFNFVAYSPDGKILATVSGNVVRLWDANTGKYEATLKGHTDNSSGFLHFIVYSPDGKTIATASSDHTVHLWNTETGKYKTTLKGHTDNIYFVAYSPDGKTIATASRDHTVRLWDANTGKNKKTLEDPAGWGLAVAYSPDGTTLATAIGNKVHLWDANIEKNKNTLKGHLDGSWGYVYSVAYSPDGKTIATASKGEVRFWDAKTGKNKGTLKGHMCPADFVMYSPDGKTIATAIGSPHHRQHDEIISLWDAITGVHKKDCKNSKKEVFSSVKSLTYSPDGKTIATVIGHKVLFWDAETGKQHEVILRGNVAWNTSMTYSPDGKIITTTSEDEVHLWNSETGKHKNTLKGHTKDITSVAYSPDGTTLASASGNEVYFWDLNIGKHINTLLGHTTTIKSVTYSPDGKTIITASPTAQGEVRLWDAETRKNKGALKGYSSLVYSPDGQTITTAKTTGEVQLWDAGMKKYKTILEHYSRSSTPVYSPDGKTLATASYDGTILLWDTQVLASQISHQPPMFTQKVDSPFQQTIDDFNKQLQPPGSTQKVVVPQTPQQVAKSALASTVLVVMEDTNGQFLNAGSGFFVARSLIATNLHVVEGVFKGYVKRVGIDRIYRIESIVAMDTRQDLAFIKVSDVSAPVLPIGRSDKVQIGESIYVAGNPLGFLEGTFSDGIISGVREFPDGSERIQITAPISEGSSGGPVLNSKGEVIGVAVSIITAGQNLNFAIPSNYLRELLDKVR